MTGLLTPYMENVQRLRVDTVWNAISYKQNAWHYSTRALQHYAVCCTCYALSTNRKHICTFIEPVAPVANLSTSKLPQR